MVTFSFYWFYPGHLSERQCDTLSFRYLTHMKGMCPSLVPSKAGLCNTKIGIAIMTYGKLGNDFNFSFSDPSRTAKSWTGGLYVSPRNLWTELWALVILVLIPSSKSRVTKVGWGYVFHSPASTSLCFEFFLQDLWCVEVLYGVSLQSCVTPSSSSSTVSFSISFCSLGFWILQASNSGFFPLFEHFSQVLPFANLWFHSKPFPNLGHYLEWCYSLSIVLQHRTVVQ